ncbi:hypothetical protein GQ464_000890 [Rhodocaloribacter litoris]|uniref:hypothetical protein n=1 Tax=Rhodocaloribacter litoris TaxID=2558931 RepID=UPI0014221396|nr:hypothetical protein [Rhodocaloribacter litoris]QXD15537.1 hypothetical protein GQ464_000890 [Rhodocaloribacter litoris]
MKQTWTMALSLVVFLVGCQAAHMPVPEALSTAGRLPVQGRQGWKIKEHLRFGSYEARDIDRSWVRGGDLVVNALELNRRKQHYSFTLRKGAADHWHVACEVLLRRGMVDAEVVDVVFADRSELACTLDAIDREAARWTLALAGEYARPLEGSLVSGGTELGIYGTSALKGGLPAGTTTGYEIVRAGRPVAAVEVISEGAVWLPETAMEGRDLFAAVATALLLLEDLRAHLPGES